MKSVKYWLLAALMAFSVIDISAQIKLQWPKNVRFIAGGLQDKRPEFKTLEAALNDVKAFATSANPYGFWVSGDTLWIEDWDSVFTESGLTMKDSIDIYYVAEGKIKWMPFGFGGTGGGVPITGQDTVTFHYDYPNWFQGNTALPIWQRRMGVALDSVDQHIFDLIVYTLLPLYIENDTLKLDTTGLGGGTTGWNPDTSTVLRTSGIQAATGTITITSGGWIFGTDSYLRLAPNNPADGVSRVIWSASNWPWWSGSGAAGDSSKFALMKDDTLRTANSVTWSNLQEAVRDSIRFSANPINAEFYWYSDNPDTIPLLTGGGWLTVGDWTADHIDGITVTSDSSFTIVTTGLYRIGYSLSFTGANSQEVEAGLFIDETLHPGSSIWRKIGTGADVGNAGTTFLAELTANEVCELKLRSPGVTGDIILHMGNINITRIR